MSIASCPVCSKVFRPRSVQAGAAWCSVSEHIRHMFRTGCEGHELLHAALYRRHNRFGCPGCNESWNSKESALEHFVLATDAVHDACRIASFSQVQGRSRRCVSRVRRPQGDSGVLYSAAKSGRSEIVHQLLAQGVNPNAGGEDGFTPLMTAAEAGHTAVITVLAADPRCKFNLKNAYGQTALAFAAQNGHNDTVLELLKCDVDVEDLCGGFTAAEIARKAGHTQIADIIAGSAADLQISKILAALTARPLRSFDSSSARITALYDDLQLSNPLSSALRTAAQDLASAREAVDEVTQERDAARDRVIAGARRADGLQEIIQNLRSRQAVGAAGPAAAVAGAPAGEHVTRRLCVICMERDVTTAVTPCFHAAFCGDCADAAVSSGGTCPMCRGLVGGKQRIYLT